MRHSWKFLGLSVALLAVAGLAFLAGARAQERLRLFPEAEQYVELGPQVVQAVRELSELVTVEMVQHTTVEKGEDHGWLNWARGDRIYMLAVARIGAGVDLTRLDADDFELDPATGRLTIRLPAPHIIYVGLDNEATHVYDRDTGLFTRGDPQLETEARQVAEEILVEAALEAGILRMANDNAIRALTSFLQGMGYEEIRIITVSA